MLYTNTPLGHEDRSVDWFEASLDLRTPPLQERREHQLLAEGLLVLIDTKAGAVRGDLEQNAVRLAKIETAKPETVHRPAVGNAKRAQTFRPILIFCIRRPECHMMH